MFSGGNGLILASRLQPLQDPLLSKIANPGQQWPQGAEYVRLEYDGMSVVQCIRFGLLVSEEIHS